MQEIWRTWAGGRFGPTSVATPVRNRTCVRDYIGNVSNNTFHVYI